jgi:hypothetical protein
LISTALFSDCRQWRYALLRIWDASKPMACFIGLNPSTADEQQDDPTIRKCIGFARLWGNGGIVMLNLYAWRETVPKKMFDREAAGIDIIGDGNNFAHLMRMAHSGTNVVVAAWGKNGGPRGFEAIKMLAPEGLCYFKLNKDGSPQHPLYMPYSQKLSKFEVIQ